MKRHFLYFLFIFNFSFLSAQQHEIDSLWNRLKNAKEDTVKVNLLNVLSGKLNETSNYDSALNCATDANILAEKLGFKKGRAMALRNIASVHFAHGNNTTALEYYTRALNLNQEISDKVGIAADYSGMGTIYENEGDYPKALDCIIKSLTISKELGNKRAIATNLSNIAIIYSDQGNTQKALESELEGLNIYEEKGIKDTNNIARCLGNIGSLYINEGNYVKALEYDSMALAIYRKTKNADGIAINLENFGIIYENEKNYSKALEYNFKALVLYGQIGDKSGIAYTLIDIGSIYTKTNNYPNSRKYLDSALNVSKEIGAKAYIQYAYQYISTLDSATGNYKKAYDDYKNYIIYRDSLINEASTKKTVQAEMNFEFEQKQAAEKAERDKAAAVAEQDRKKQAILLYSFMVGFGLMIALAFFIFRGLREKQKANTIITKQKEEVEKQKTLIEHQKAIVDEKNKDITDSIHYASCIQKALLTTDGYISKYLKEYFILFKPRDIVSGDFYWAIEVNESGASRFLICAGDCTGHGVPGAFMSLLNISMLNETTIEKKIHSPAAVLDDVRTHIIKALNPGGTDGGSKDGMDCVLCSLDLEKYKLDFACANNPLWIIRNKECIEFKPDKMPVGIQSEKHIPFTSQSVSIQRGDVLYLFTDGYADQFGGPKGKKFKYKALQEKLIAISHQPMTDQKKILDETIEGWRGSLEQVDDVLVIGIRV
ncbi:MAG TPA: tetratricopeptide repeat protein [Bacteroidia bacterium]|jgi:serine phosphatase RsbU (regulator of sigma subunit)|nr:tetratricopeptide repeat protein [Bacteroidia bacterium]